LAGLNTAENPNAPNWVGTPPYFRRALKFRLVFPAAGSAKAVALHAYGSSRWNRRDVIVQSGCEGKAAADLSATAYNGEIVGTSRFSGDPPGLRLSVLYAEHVPGSNDRTVVTLRGLKYPFGFSMDDVVSRKGLYVKPQGIFIGDSSFGDFQSYLRSGMLRDGEDIISRTNRETEQALDRARGEVPALSMTSRSGRHPLRYIPLGLPSAREKYGLDFNGNVFINKKSVKAMKEDLARMQWTGDEIYFRIGTGAMPDFRERENSARQSLLEGYLPVASTTWESEGIEYAEEAFVSLLMPSQKAWELRGDEPTLMVLRLTASNPGKESRKAHVWFYTTPQEEIRLSQRVLEARSSIDQPFHFRTALSPSQGDFALVPLPRGAKYTGRAAHWEAQLPPGTRQSCIFKIPFRTSFTDNLREAALLEKDSQQRSWYDVLRTGVIDLWERLLTGGMQINVPDALLNTFYTAVLQHIYLTVQRDVGSGLYMCPCGTYDYNMFANETCIQVRLLDMMGRHEEAWRCLQPYVQLQGSKPFPGRFQDKSAIFHGALVDAEHDYTHHGYNLNHGWVLWTLAEHYLYTRDKEFLREQLPRILKAANWIVSERQATKQKETDSSRVWEYGLLPAGQLEDNEEFQYWYAVNAYAYRGLNAAATAVADIDASEGARLKKEAADYRADIRDAAVRSMAAAPAVPLRDGTFVPMIPSRTSLHGREFGWIRNILYGPHTMVDCGIFDSGEEIATWILQDLEDNLFMAEDSLSIPDSDWFSRGGVALQPNLVNTVVSYMERNQLPQALRAFYNTFAISLYPDVNAFTEWVPTLGKSGGPFYKTSDEAAFVTWLRLILVRESGNDLALVSGAPRAWFAPTKVIEIKDASTLLGKVSYRIESDGDRGTIRAHVDLESREELQNTFLTLRHPERKKIQRVELNGRPWADFDTAREAVRLPKKEAAIDLVAYY
jgi:hypothetical protein